MARDQMNFFRSYFEAGMCIQNPKERLAFFEAIIELGLNGREIPLTGMAKAIFVGIRPNILRSVKRAESRAAKAEASSNNKSDFDDTNGMTNGATNGGNKFEIEETTFAEVPYKGKGVGVGEGKGIGLGEGVGEGGNSAAPATPRPLPTGFIPPSVEEVRAYCAERGNNIDPERFVAYNEARGWRIGKQLMKNWKAAVRSWEKNGIADEKPKDQSGSDSSFDRDEFFEAAIRATYRQYGKDYEED